MNFFITLLCFTFTISFSKQKTNPNLRIVNKGLEPVSPNAVGLIFFVDVNNTSNDVDYDAELVPDRCCLQQGRDPECDVLEMAGGCVQTIPRREVTTLKVVVPIIDLYERYGRCSVYLDTKAVDNKRSAMRNNIDIPFDTRVTNASVEEILENVKVCKNADQDPLNDCNPVDCKTFYNDKKPFYSDRRKRCVNAPSCISDHGEIPTSVYDPVQNKCKEEAITKEDIEYVKQKLQGKSRIGKDLVIIKKFKENPPDLIDVYKKKLYKLRPFVRSNKEKSKLDFVMSYLNKSKWGMIGLFSLIFIQCLLIIALVSCSLKNCRYCAKNKVVENKYWNAYRQEASVTTPLMGLTNDTDTTRQFQSDSFNIDKRINCYKACQKEKQKSCLSDDILAKCVNRRNWNSRSEANKNFQDPQNIYNTLYYTNSKPKTSIEIENERAEMKGKSKNTVKIGKTTSGNKADRGKGDTKETAASRKAMNKYDMEDKKNSSYGAQRRSKIVKGDSRYLTSASEKELKCYSYNDYDIPSSDMALRRNEYSSSKTDVKGNKSHMSHNYKYNRESSGISLKDSTYSNTDVKREESEEVECHTYNYNISRSESSKGSSDNSSEVKENKTSRSRKHIVRSNVTKLGDGDAPKEQASVQASFPNDSLDDFLSERGMLFMTGENISKYSFSDQSLHSTAITSRTSKNNLMRNIFSFLKREKQGPSSEPGKNKYHDSVNLELIHMSRATMYSSSNNENDCFKAEPKHSTTSL